ncbi:MAG: TIR domain-containing protein [Gaiellaceae bacterium]
MARQIFHSFRHSQDNWRVQTIRQIGVIEGQKLLSGNDWEAVKKQGDAAIQNWIDTQMTGRSCVVVLIGSATAGRRWVNYEMRKGWADRKGVVGIHIHGLKDGSGNQAAMGANPLEFVTVSTNVGDRALSSVAKTYDPPYSTSTYVYDHIKKNIEDWIEEAIIIRNAN